MVSLSRLTWVWVLILFIAWWDLVGFVCLCCFRWWFGLYIGVVFVVGGGLYSDCWMVELLLGVVALRFCFARLELLIVLLFFFLCFFVCCVVLVGVCLCDGFVA